MTTLEHKIPKLALLLLCILGADYPTDAQVPSPKHEGRLHHLIARHRDSDNLIDRYKNLSCALVLIQAGPRLGTGFYIDENGDVVTASHVVGDRVFSQVPGGKMEIVLNNVPYAFDLKDNSGEYTVPVAGVDLNVDNWVYDLAIIHSKKRPPCWLALGDDKKAQPGEHVITLGFPGLAFGSMTIYTGIMSARLRTDLPSGKTLQGAIVRPSNDSLRVQMPISPGISGAPIIDDENHVIGVVTTAGVWGQDLEQLTAYQRMRESQPNQPTPPPGTIDFPAVVAHLASVLHEFASPGYGDAVPMSYLVRKPSPSNPPRTGSSH